MSHRLAPPSSTSAPCVSPSASSSTAPTASPICMPRRPASKGRQPCGSSNISEWKPDRAPTLRPSTPITSARRASPRRSMAAATSKALALEEQAVVIVSTGPSKPKSAATRRATSPGGDSGGMTACPVTARVWRYSASPANRKLLVPKISAVSRRSVSARPASASASRATVSMAAVANSAPGGKGARSIWLT